MKTKDIREGTVYIGSGTYYIREVEFITEGGRVSWFCPFPVRVKRGVDCMPHGVCSLKTFARWATEERT